MKAEIKRVANRMSVDGRSYPGFYNRVRQAVLADPSYQDPTLVSFLKELILFSI